MNIIKNSMRPFFVRLLALFLLVLVSFSYFYFAAHSIDAAWFNDGWRYRVAVPISAHTAAENNVYLNLTGSDGINTTDTTKFQTDCGDIRFTDSNGNILPYYLTTACGLAQTGFHVFLSTFPAGAQTIYYYYGNAGASNGFSPSDFPVAATGVTLGTRGSEANSPVSPVAFWKFDEGHGQTLNSTNSTTYPGTLGPDNTATSTDPTWMTEDLCISGKCLKFISTSSQYVNISSSIASIKSIGFWVRPSTTSTSLAVLNGAAGNASLSVASGTIAAGAGFTSPTIYVNGVVSSTLIANTWQYVTVTTGTGITASNIMLGRVNTGYLNGFMDEVKVYGVTLSAAQIKANYAGGQAGVASVKGTSTSFGSSTTNTLSNGLIGYWKMDEKTGTTTSDSSGNGNNGTLTNSPTWVAGKFGTAINTNSTSAYVNVGDPVSGILDFNDTDNFTISSWIKTSSTLTNNGEILYKGFGGGDPGYRFRLANTTGYFNCEIADSAAGTTQLSSNGPSLNDGVWHFVTCVLSNSGTQLTVFVDGVQKNTVADSEGSLVSAKNLEIGRNSATSYFPGDIDEVRIYNRALSVAEIKKLYSYAPGPIGWWKLDENTGGTAYDSSGNGYNFTTLGTWKGGKYGSGNYTGNNQAIGSSQLGGSLDNAGAFTFSYWLNVISGDVDWRPTFMQKDADATHYIDTQASTVSYPNRIYFIIANGSVAEGYADNLFSIGQWVHITEVFDGSGSTNAERLKVYKNGTKIPLSYTGTIPSSTADLSVDTFRAINSNSSTNPTILDDLRIYNYARTPGQIIEDMGGQIGKRGGPLIFMKFDETSNRTNNSGSLGNSKYGTLNNATWSNNGKFGKGIQLTGTTGSNVSIADFDY